MKKILVIDGNSIINRAYYGVRLLTNKQGKYTNAIYGTVNMISRQLDEIKPDYTIAAFDVKHPTFRHEMYADYKQGRHPTPTELLSQFEDAKECLRLMGITVMELPGWEADDIQGTVAKMAHGEEDTESYVFSGDRDLLQLIDDRVTVLLATNSETLVMREKEFKEKYGVAPSSFVEMKALMGDSSDNIPGVGGIGEKTASALIQNFGTLEEIYANIEDKRISKGVREKLLRDKDNAFLSRKLAQIDTHAPLRVNLEDIKYRGFDKPGLYKKFTELELKSFIVKFGLTANEDQAEEKASELVSADYEEITDGAFPTGQFDIICADYSHEGKLYFTINSKNYVYSGDISNTAPIFENKKIICYDGKSLFHKLDKSGIKADTGTYLDLMIYEYLLNPGSGSAGLASLSAMFLGKTVDNCAPCTYLYCELEQALLIKIRKAGMERVLTELEIPLINVLAKTEKAGFKINKAGILEFAEALGELADELAQRIYMQAGEVFNIASPKQLGEVLYGKLGLAKKKKGKTGYPTDAQTLEEMRALSPIIDDILEYRQVTKLKGTYTTALTDAADENGRIHTEFKQALTATGRLSSAEPNLQNIPIRTKMGRELRRFFIAEDGYTLVDADYSQIELRLLAHISGDYTMTEAFKDGEDIHRKTASAVFGVPEEAVTEEMRKRAKAVNFGIVYGIGGYSLAKDIGSSVAEASKYIKNYLMNYPDIDRYLEKAVKDAEADGYTTTLMGRRRYIPELRASQAPMRAFGKRVAMNAPIQGSAADIMKLAMINVCRAIEEKGLDARLVMQVHDELIVEARDSDVETVKTLLVSEMENAVKLSIPLTVDVTSGKNWLEQE